MYKYYSSLRPVSIGTYPKEGMTGFKNYDWRKTTPAGEAWGELYYCRELTEKEIRNYDLIPDEENARTNTEEEAAEIRAMSDLDLHYLLLEICRKECPSEYDMDTYGIALKEIVRRAGWT